jgi:hypothetical protein
MAEQKRDPVEYIVLEKSLIGNEIFEAGTTAKYDGLPAENLQPTCDEGRARYQEYVESNAARLAKMREQYAEAPGVAGDPNAFAAAFRKELAEANAQHAEAQRQLLETLAAAAQAQKDAIASAVSEAQKGQAELIAAAVAAAIAQVFPNGTAKKAVEPAAPIA